MPEGEQLCGLWCYRIMSWVGNVEEFAVVVGCVLFIMHFSQSKNALLLNLFTKTLPLFRLTKAGSYIPIPSEQAVQYNENDFLPIFKYS